MGPFPHDAPPATISAYNPAGTDGFEFVEFAHPEPARLETLFRQMGYVEVARHKSKDISLYRQGRINYVLNRDTGTHAARFVDQHGPCAPAMAWRVVDARHALKRALDLGATEYTGDDKSLDVPAVIGIGGSLLYFVDRYGAKGSPYADAYRWLGDADPDPEGVGFFYIDHLTHNVMRGNMDTWYRFYAETFNFREIAPTTSMRRPTRSRSAALNSCRARRTPTI
jgi:4-hydroxyphenylpyruvate dioxygenase